MEGAKQFSRRIASWTLSIGLSAWWMMVAGCGYTLVGTSPAAAPNRVVVLVVPVAVNLTREPGLEQQMTASLRREFLQAPVFQLVSQQRDAYTLQSTALQFLSHAASLDASDRVVQFRIESRMRIRLLARQSHELIIEQEIDVWAEYLVSPSGSVREHATARMAALTRMSRQFAQQCRALVEMILI